MAEEQTPDNVNTIEDLVQYSLSQDYNKANEIFGNVITTKLSDVLDQEKIKLAGQIYNGDPEEDIDEPTDEDLEDTGQDEDEEESEEESQEESQEESEDESEDESV